MFRQLFQVTIQKFMPQTHIVMTTYSALKSSNHSPKYIDIYTILVWLLCQINLISIWFQGSALRKVGITANAKIPHKYIRGEWRENESRLRKGWTYIAFTQSRRPNQMWVVLLAELKHEEAWNNKYGHTNLLQLLTSSFKCQWSLISSHKQMPTASNWRATTGPLILLHWTIKNFTLYLDLTGGVTFDDLELISVHASIQVTMASANFVK